MQNAKLTLVGPEGGQALSFTPPVTLSELLLRLGAKLEMPCGGRRKCRKCRVLAEGALSDPDEQELALLSDAEKAAGIRFACMALALGDVQVRLLSGGGGDQIQTEGSLPAFALAPWGKAYGVAADIGTTTVAAYLYRLADGTRLAAESAVNPQAKFGADVISRMEKAMGGMGPALAEAIGACLAQLTEALCARAGIASRDIDAMVLTGNTAMLYLLCGRDPSSLASLPFRADCLFGQRLFPETLPLPKSIPVYLPRCISAYVGADITMALLAAGLLAEGRVSEGPARLLADIGTNGEIALASEGRLVCCATAAGPAFEGAGISCGMMAREGAISRVDCVDGDIRCEVIGGGDAVGICGSGLIDAVAAMLDASIVDETGVIDREERAFTLPGTRVTLTQQDVRAVQLAKAAICAGIQTLMLEAHVSLEALDSLIIAGGFGSHVRIASAERIGLIPQGMGQKAYAIGNGAGMGASMALLSDTLRLESEGIDSLAQVVELSTDPRFMDAYVENMFFPVRD